MDSRNSPNAIASIGAGLGGSMPLGAGLATESSMGNVGNKPIGESALNSKRDSIE